MPVALKASWTVRGGLIPGSNVQPELTRQWIYTSDDYAIDSEATRGETPGPHPEKPPTRFETRRIEAAAYWAELNDPRQHNWAELVFIWY
jgi:hypothetical protein